MRISIDTSLLAHGLIPSQQTADARQALREIAVQRHETYASAGLYLEFLSLLRRSVNKRTLTAADAHHLFVSLGASGMAPVPLSMPLLNRAWAIATRLDQGDVFDAMGYAVAEEIGGEFWTCDRRFANAAQAAGLPRLRYVR